MTIVNLSAYKFIRLDALPALRERLHDACAQQSLKGTILLAPEGINLLLAGAREAIDGFMAWLHEDPRFADIVPKQSLSASTPFRRLRVRLKKEIITMRMPAIRPEGDRAPVVDAVTLRRWLGQGHDDHGRRVVMLDTRNDYETAVGAFDDAIDYQLASFTGFPAAIAADRARYEDRTVVSYCTGGIRCEKAALHMCELGLSHVYQLDGGILTYLEQTDGRHWHGDCFVFDERGAVDATLAPASSALHATERIGVSSQPGGGPPSAPALPPLPAGERVGVRGHSGVEPASEEQASTDDCASTRPSSAPAGQLHTGHPWPSPSQRLTPCNPAALPIGLPNGEKGLHA